MIRLKRRIISLNLHQKSWYFTEFYRITCVWFNIYWTKFHHAILTFSILHALFISLDPSKHVNWSLTSAPNGGLSGFSSLAYCPKSGVDKWGLFHLPHTRDRQSCFRCKEIDEALSMPQLILITNFTELLHVLQSAG